MNIDKIYKILKSELFYKDIADMIMEYTFDKCDLCQDYEEKESLSKNYNNTHTCPKCLGKNEYKTCNNCNLFYDYNISLYCSSCFDGCRIYCPMCLDNRFKIKKD